MRNALAARLTTRRVWELFIGTSLRDAPRSAALSDRRRHRLPYKVYFFKYIFSILGTEEP
ncbi:hypothetical protein [Nostoc sp. C117]|uniref:hypothetical protein n=1 Tax=Nostoc sp. C117 TaxID=3349875 RepID=UPI00370D24CC